ncbi:DUF6252 family protein [Mucilaginibacter ginsenosidivorans]|uniref:Uncharacterized protein n=1 Tax=Mucilaginibacter ginsenosidivorans TaxID=398053 RepID=A0A5B8UWK7_9SPHI|nr:DUF6252 family protein [Mucilaginibacter ginsenosidivorans]QEC63309.1 hypothetical protein FRZ54_12215 [Mucilaginibacter ginsenosidivorans]
MMKVLIAGSCAAAFSGCKKDNIQPDNFLIYKIDEGPLVSVEGEADYFYDDNSIMVTNGSGGNDLYIFIDTNIRVGAYPIGNLSSGIGATYYDSRSRSFNSDTGLIVIKEYDDNHIAGTFHFTATDGNTTKKNNRRAVFGEIILSLVFNGYYLR